MREVLDRSPAPRPTPRTPTIPTAVREWCINTAAVNPATNSVFTPSEDGHIYRWNLATNSLAQAARLTPGIGEPYVPTVIGPDGTVYTLNGGTLFALGGVERRRGRAVLLVPDDRAVVAGQSLTFTAAVDEHRPRRRLPPAPSRSRTPSTSWPAPTIWRARRRSLASGVAAGRRRPRGCDDRGALPGQPLHQALYSGGGYFSPAARLVQRIHDIASSTTLLPRPILRARARRSRSRPRWRRCPRDPGRRRAW